MRKGEIIKFYDSNIRDNLEPMEFQMFAYIELWNDDVNIDDSLGSLHLTRSRTGENIPFDFPSIDGESNYSYTLYYDFYIKLLTEEIYRIDFLRLSCNHPQGRIDKVKLIVNDDKVWNSDDRGGMKKRDDVIFHGLSRIFNDSVTVVLSKPKGQDWEVSHANDAKDHELDTSVPLYLK